MVQGKKYIFIVFVVILIGRNDIVFFVVSLQRQLLFRLTINDT
jgi:hypothetical protein